MASQGPLVLQSPGTVFRDILKKQVDTEALEDKKKETKGKKKKKKDEKKEEKRVFEPEDKHVIREGENSLITYTNPSVFSVFSRIRHFILQNQLCDTYNSRLTQDSQEKDDDEDSDSEDSSKKSESNKLPVVVGLGVKGVFTIIREIRHTQPELCLRALKELTNILQGQTPDGLKHEPKESTDCLFELLLEMVADRSPPSEEIAVQLSSVASGCLLSLVVALGDTGKMLAAIAALLTAHYDSSQAYVQIPQIFYKLQTSVQAVLLGSVLETDWSLHGVPSGSLAETWPLPLPDSCSTDKETPSSVACDGKFLYFHGTFGLLKVGSGYANTRKGHLYQCNQELKSDTPSWLGYCSGKLYFYPLGSGEETISVINPDTLTIDDVLALESDAVGSMCLFTDGEILGQIRAKKEGGFVVRKFTTICSPMPVVEESQLQLSQKSVLVMGKAKYDNQGELHTAYQDGSEQVAQVLAGRSFAAVRTSSGKLVYTGSGFALGANDVPKGEWQEVELPDKNVRVEHCSTDNAGTFCLVISDKGVAYFSGLNKKGESGENAGRQQNKPVKLKRMQKVKDQKIVTSACSTHASALVSSEGKLFMFGNLDEDLTDKSTGVVTSMLGIPASQVAMGRSHTCVLTQLGTVFTFGSNNYGQCGRNYVPPKDNEPVAGDVGEEVESSSEEDNDGMCASGDHKWSNTVCKVCKFCGFCTGYGPGCCNEGQAGRDPGNACGCGSGDSGCSECGCCKVCAGQQDSWGGGGGPFNELPEEVLQIRRRIGKGKKGKKAKNEAEKDEQKGEKGEKAMAEGLKLLFGNEGRSVSVEASGVNAGPGVEEKPSTKKPATIPLPDEMTAMQVECGTFHTALLLHSGEVYMFGNGNHGQLGQGNNKISGDLVKVPLPEAASQVACGDNHTVVLLTSGKVMTFGKHQEGQLGRNKGLEQDQDSWSTSPGFVDCLCDERKAKWIGARGNQTFIVVDEQLIVEGTISQYSTMANSSVIGLVPPKNTPKEHSHTILIERAGKNESGEQFKTKRMDGSSQQNLSGCGVCMDPEYDVLWSYSPSTNKVASFNPVVGNIENPAGTILSSSICLPRSSNAQTSRSHLALNLLSSLTTLATHPSLSPEAMATVAIKKKYDKDDYHAVLRFNSHGGSWGYSNSSAEAIRFSPDADVLLGGFGLYGGRGNYTAEIKVMDIGEAGGEKESEGTVLASHNESSYTCEKQQTCRILFDKPVLLSAGNWYIAYAVVSSPSGASSDAGSSGQATMQGPDKVTFKFKSARKSNNGTDVNSGQIPEILYRIPEPEKVEGVQLQMVDREFSTSVSASGITALLQLLDWSWGKLSQMKSTDDIMFIAKSSLNLLKTYIQLAFPEKGKPSNPKLDSAELAAALYEGHRLLRRILSIRQPLELGSPLSDVMSACRSCFSHCFHAFYPSTPLKWLALCQQLQTIDPSDVVSGIPMENLLSAILEALTQPTVSYIGLSYDKTQSIKSAIHNSEPSEKFPVLSEYMHMKTMEENGEGELLGFNAIATKLLGIVAAPIHSALATKQNEVSQVVSKAGALLLSRINELSLCVSYPESAAKLGLPILQQERKEQIVESSPRLKDRECGYPALTVTDLAFSVNKPVIIRGVTVYGHSTGAYKYKLTISSTEDEESAKTGSFKHTDCSGEYSTVGLLFKQPLKLKVDVVYTVHLELEGESYSVGVDGKLSLTGPGGSVFTLHHTGSKEGDPETGPILNFLYTPCSSSGPQNVVQLSVHIASMLLDVTVGFLERVLGGEMTNEVFSLLGSSILFSTLLPSTLAQLGPIACRQPKYAVEVLSLVKRTLTVVSAVSSKATKLLNSQPLNSDLSSMHYATVETEHPYKPACVKHYKVKFCESVQWMTLEFDPRTGFAQSEDKLGELMIPCTRPGGAKPGQANPSPPEVTLMGVGFEDMYNDWERYSLDSPPGLVLLPGNEVHIMVQADTEYDKKDSNNHFGLKCQVVGYEWTNNTANSLLLLEKELVSLGTMCASSLIRENMQLPFVEELGVSSQNQSEKADMRIIQASSQEVLTKHSAVLSRGLMVEQPTIHQILQGEIPVIRDSTEQSFLSDFIESKAGTPGGRLARWLQPDRAVDPEACVLEVPSEPIKTSVNSEFMVHVKDQDGKPVYVEGMKVEVKAVWLGKQDGISNDRVSVSDKLVDKVMGVRKPTYKRPYSATKSNSNHVYHCISMMMPYSNYSFEELRLFAPKTERSSENMRLESQDDGSYSAQWVPSVSGKYLIQVFIDGRSTGQEEYAEVLEPELPPEQDSPVEVVEEPMPEEEPSLETPPTKHKLKVFSGKAAAGVRVRKSPSLIADPLGVIRPGDVFPYSDTIDNSEGTWVKLTQLAISELCPGVESMEAYAMVFSKEKQLQTLEEFTAEPSPALKAKLGEVQAAQVVKSVPSKKRQGGIGLYLVVQCGSAGHNVRSKPGLRGTPVGRLKKGDTIDTQEEVENDDGVWLKLSTDHLKKFCNSETDEAWTLAVGPSGRIFLSREGDTSYQSQVVDSKAQAPSPQIFPTAASVFGTSPQSVFGKPLVPNPPPPPVFNFGSGTSALVELKFGASPTTVEEKKDGEHKLRAIKVPRLRRRFGRKAKSPSPQPVKKEEDEEPVHKELLTDEVVSKPSSGKQALSPAVAECQRAVFAAFLWQEGLVYDSIASASHLMRNPNMTKPVPEPKIPEETTTEGDKEDKPSPEEGEESPPLVPPTLNHLITFWEEISCKVIENSNMSFSPPKVPELAAQLLKRYEEEKSEIEKRKKEKDKKVQFAGAGGGSTLCELCNQTFNDPVTYHMKEAHPGCGRHASGWGYNSKGTFCSGWAGNCGDGGRGGSTWYLMCKACHVKYLAMKDESKKRTVKPVVLPKMKTRRPGKPRNLPPLTAVQGMIQNAKFLLEIARCSDNTPTTPSALKLPAIVEIKVGAVERQFSSPSDEKPVLPRAGSIQNEPDTAKPVFLRSKSMAAGKQEEASTGTKPKALYDPLMSKPSKNLRRLMYSRSRKGPSETGYNRVVAFLLVYHDLDGLRASMKQSMRVAGIKAHALEFIEWLLAKVTEPSVIHDVLWQFNSALRDHPVQEMADKVKAKEGKAQKNDKMSEPDDLSLGHHPLSGLDGAGIMLQLLRKQFHSFLQTTSNIMPKLPSGSAVQQASMQCYCLQFQPQDHSFLLQSDVFSNISKALSLSEDNTEKKSLRDKSVDISLMEDVLPKGQLKVSSNDAMKNSLTDASTETFWESRDEPRGQPRKLTVSFDEERPLLACAVHIDNQKDGGQKVESVSLLVGKDEDGLREVDKVKLTSVHSGWKVLVVPDNTPYSVLRLELKAMSNNIRVRQVQVLASPSKPLESSFSAAVSQQKACEAEALRVFRLLTSQVFGRLLSSPPEEGQDEADSAEPADADKEGKEDEVREHVVDILFSKDKLTNLQKQVCAHIIQSVNTETSRMKEEWEGAVSNPSPPKPSRQTSIDTLHDLVKGSDNYCYELLSMLIGLSQSEVGCTFLSEQQKLIQDLFTLLHVGTCRLQLQVCTLFRKVLPAVGPKNLAPMLNVRILPPLGYSAIAEAVNTAATINQLGILDCLIAVISKGLSVQIKAKGRSTNIIQLLTGESSIPAITMDKLKNPKPVPGETTIRAQRWYLRGSVSQEVAGEVIKLVKDMVLGSLGGQWEGYSKSAIGQAVLHLTKINEEARVPVPGTFSQTLWLCLGALCVIDTEHAEALSSGQWLGQDGKPKSKPLCDNHDDGESQALISCDKCGNLCGECDRVLHYPRGTRDHQRQIFKEEEEAVKVDLHEGCGRIKLYWTMALADCRTLKGLVEFKEAGSGGGKGSCRFCGTTSNTGLLAIGNVCADPECQERVDLVCDKTLACGHPCNGVKGEESCLSCLHGCASDDPKLRQDADDMCMVCYTEGLSCAPCIQLECGHVFHYHCCRSTLTKRWSGPRITFRFMFCSICVNTPIAHPKLADVLDPITDLFDDTKRKCLLRLEYENQSKCEAITSPSSKFYKKPAEYAMWKYAYYVCFKCKKAYYGGEAHCAEQVAASDDYDPSELVCPACSNVGGAMQVCPKHGTDFLEYKCRYCCSVAVYFCFGTTHFCNPCHDDFQRLTSMSKSELPQCPVGPLAKPLEGTECPLHIKHPPTGEEFALGCGVCRNAQHF